MTVSEETIRAARHELTAVAHLVVDDQQRTQLLQIAELLKSPAEADLRYVDDINVVDIPGLEPAMANELAEVGLHPDQFAQIQLDAMQLARLYLRGYLTSAEFARSRTKLLRHIKRAITTARKEQTCQPQAA